ncbi:MAG: protein kinase [Polyangiaceae bacterium]
MSDERRAGRDAAAALKTMASAGVASTFRPSELDEPPAEATAFVLERLQSERAEPAREARPDPYEIVDILGRGGMAEVFRARDTTLGRVVAIKQILKSTPTMLRHFLAEARVTANLEHANIIPVHAIAESPDGVPRIAMKLVDGASWEDRLSSAPENLGNQLTILLSVCNAVEYAHDAGILHRDIKPANVMIARFGQVFVVDWGIAVALDRERASELGMLAACDVKRPAGTPAYMAPELATGDGQAQTAETDVYLLGACLHHVITGSPPHAFPTLREALEHAIASEPPAYPEHVPAELAAIARRAMARDPADRYRNVREFADAIERFLEHRASRAISLKAVETVALLEAEVASFRAARDDAKKELGRRVHDHFTEAMFGFGLALEGWPEDEDAALGQRRARTAMLAHALDSEDLPLATRLEGELGQVEPELEGRLASLRARDAERRAELERLREQAAMLDEGRIAKPLGNLFLFAACAGAAVTYPCRIALDRGWEVMLFGLWSSVAAATGALAWLTLRGARSLVSPRVGVTWAAVALGLTLASIVDKLQGEQPFQNVSYATMMVAIGFVAQAMQTRRWLLGPAAFAFLGALVMASAPSRRVEIFGVVWFLLLGGVGVALRRGARVLT